MQSSPPEGSILFSYVQTDEFCERFEASRCITTSRWEGQNHLARKLATDARNRQKVRAVWLSHAHRKALCTWQGKASPVWALQAVLLRVQLHDVCALCCCLVCLQMLNFQSMCIIADLGDATTVAGSNEKVLCVLRAHHDGSFDMTPGFSTPAQRYRFEDDHGVCTAGGV